MFIVGYIRNAAIPNKEDLIEVINYNRRAQYFCLLTRSPLCDLRTGTYVGYIWSSELLFLL